MEKRFPFLSIRLPKRLWNTEYHFHARNNKNKLIGAYDVYQTLRHFLHLNINYENKLDSRQFSQNEKNIRHLRGISLFERIPVNRSCSDTFIPQQYCSCNDESRITIQDFKKLTKIANGVEKVQNLALDYVNNLTSHIRDKCEIYRLQELESIKLISNENSKSRNFQFTFIFEPGKSFFEATIEASHETKEIKILGKVLRLSRYGLQSICIEDSFLKNYCYCKKINK